MKFTKEMTEFVEGFNTAFRQKHCQFVCDTGKYPKKVFVSIEMWYKIEMYLPYLMSFVKISQDTDDKRILEYVGCRVYKVIETGVIEFAL